MMSQTRASDFWFARVRIAVMRDSSLSPCEKAVYAIICTHANIRSQTATLSVATIAKETNCSERTAQKCIKELVARGVLERKERFITGRQIACLYRIAASNTLSDEMKGADSAGSVENDIPATIENVENFAPEGEESADKREPVFDENQKNNPFPPTPQNGGEGEVEKSSNGENPDHDTTGPEQKPSSKTCEAILALYHRILPELPPVASLQPSNIREIEARIREDPARREVTWWERYFRSIRDYPCAMGKSGSGWKAHFGWLVSEKGTAAHSSGIPARKAAARAAGRFKNSSRTRRASSMEERCYGSCSGMGQNIRSIADASQRVVTMLAEKEKKIAEITTCPGPCTDGFVLIELQLGDDHVVQQVDCPIIGPNCAYGVALQRQIDKHLAELMTGKVGIPRRHVARFERYMETIATKEAARWGTRGFLVLSGKTGCGKSYAAAWFVDRYLRSRIGNPYQSETWEWRTKAESAPPV